MQYFFFKWFCKLFILGFCAIILISILFKKIFSLSSLFKIFSNKTVDLIFLYFLSLFGKKDPILPKAAAPRIESIIACKTGSPSECPRVPTFDFILRRC